MGLFSRWTEKKQVIVEDRREAHATEAKEKKSATETGRERVTSIRSAMKESWNKWSGKVMSGGKWLLEGAASLGYVAIGGSEKVVRATGRGIESGYKAVGEFGSETVTEAGQLVEKGVGALNDWAQNQVENYDAGRKFVGDVFNVGVEALNVWAQKQVDDYNAFKRNVENAPADAKREWEALKARVLKAITEQFTAASKDAAQTFSKATKEVSDERDKFFGWLNKKRAELAGTADLQGEVQSLREQVERQNRLIENLLRLQGVEPANPAEADQEEQPTEAMA